MNKIVKPLAVSSLAVLLLCAHGAGWKVLAQDNTAEQPPADAAGKKPTTETFGTWTLVCSTGETKRCIAQQQLVDPKDQRVVAAATVRLTKEGGAELTMQLPSGVVLAPGVTLTVDGKEIAKAPFVACAPRACEATFKIDQDLINGLAKGKSFSAVVESLRGKSANIDFQLDGFIKAYAAFKKGVTQ